MGNAINIQMDRRTALAGLTCALTLTACDLLVPAYTIRFRYEIELNVGGKPAIGSSVFEVRWKRTFLEGLDAIQRYEKRIWAEAPIIEYRPGQFAFALLWPPHEIGPGFSVRSDYFVPLLFSDQSAARAAYGDGSYFTTLAAFKGRYDLTEDTKPFLVRFRNRQDKRSAELFPNARDANDIQITRAGVTVTDAPVSHRLTNILPWAKEKGGLSFEEEDVSPSHPTISTLLNRTHFLLSGE